LLAERYCTLDVAVLCCCVDRNHGSLPLPLGLFALLLPGHFQLHSELQAWFM
jgi:hypothetical protein